MKVSVLVMTYNHAQFITQALDSVLMQQVNCEYEVLISEDCSTDGTREIVLDYQKKHPNKIQLLLSEQNLHSNAVVVRGIRAARGEYIALLDGDDYWVSPDKLQKQIDFLDAHPECSMCFHNATVIHEDGSREPWNWTSPHQKEISTFEDIWQGNFIATCSTMFRRGLFGEMPDWYNSMFPITDWPLHILNAEHGKIGYINEVMGVYRYHKEGFYSPLSQAQKQEETLKFYRVMNSNLNYKYDKIINTALSSYFFWCAEEYYARQELSRARACFRICLTAQPINKFISLKQLLVLGLNLYKPHWITLKGLALNHE